jgi:starvation-inducible DNA-binding protein
MEKHLHAILLLVIASALYINIQSQHDDQEPATMNPPLTVINIGLSEQSRSTIADQLSILLANLYIVYTKTLNYHWNVEGPFFNDLHKFFGDLYEKQFGMIDRIAERIRALGHKSPGSLATFMNKTILSEHPNKHLKAQGMIADLLYDYNAIIRSMRSIADAAMNVNDVGTNNFIGDLIEQSEKSAWMLRSLLV